MLVRIWKKINHDKMRKEVAIGKVAAHLCLTLIIKKKKSKTSVDITLSKAITMFCGIDKIIAKNILHNTVNPVEHCYGSKIMRD